MEPHQSLKSWNVQFDFKIGRSSSPSWCFTSANWNTHLHNNISHGAITPQTISHFTAPPIGQSVTNVDKHKKWQKGPPSMNGSKS
jgi:hypothetical protein